VVIRSDGETVEFSYPEIEVVNGSIASFTLPDSQSTKNDPPEMTVQTENSVLTFLPEVVEVSSIRVVAHELCSFVDSQGELSDFVSEYSVDDVVFSWLDIADASVGDHVHWVFNGPDSHEMVFDYTVNWVGEGTTWANFSLADYENVMGPWSVDVFINGDFVSSLDFEIVDEGFKIPGCARAYMAICQIFLKN
jgi:hypothetical protein